MRRYIESALMKVLSYRMARQADAVELMPKYRLNKHVNLEKSEIEEIDKVWKPFGHTLNYKYWMVYKSLFPFTPFLVPDDIYVRDILRVLNPMRKCYCLQNKNMYPLIYSGLRQPPTLINCIDGQARDRGNKHMVKHHIINTLTGGGKRNHVIIKPSADSCSGQGVHILNLDDEKRCIETIDSTGANYVIQELVSQSQQTSRFNPSSLNTFRVNTLNLNGNITVENIMFRHGRGDSIVDNAGAGGICVGFNTEGQAIGKAIDAGLSEYEFTPFGEKYSDLVIPELKSICKQAIAAHLDYLPMMGHAAWDFALNEDNEPVFIEVNLGWPGIMTEQLSSCRPIFGNRTEEVIDFAKSNKSKMLFTDFLGHWT